jgi:hypothetical protein
MKGVAVWRCVFQIIWANERRFGGVRIPKDWTRFRGKRLTLPLDMLLFLLCNTVLTIQVLLVDMLVLHDG